MKRKFSPGQVVATAGALELLKGAPPAMALTLLERHLDGDWGDVCKEDAKLNDEAVKNGTRMLSAYILPSGEKLWIITEADRSVTTLLLPEEY